MSFHDNDLFMQVVGQPLKANLSQKKIDMWNFLVL